MQKNVYDAMGNQIGGKVLGERESRILRIGGTNGPIYEGGVWLKPEYKKYYKLNAQGQPIKGISQERKRNEAVPSRAPYTEQEMMRMSPQMLASIPNELRPETINNPRLKQYQRSVPSANPPPLTEDARRARLKAHYSRGRERRRAPEGHGTPREWERRPAPEGHGTLQGNQPVFAVDPGIREQRFDAGGAVFKPTTLDRAQPFVQNRAAQAGAQSQRTANPTTPDMNQTQTRHRTQMRSQRSGFSGNRRFHPFSGG